MAEFGMARRPTTGNPASAYARLREKTLALHPRTMSMFCGTTAVQQLVPDHLKLTVHAELAPLEALWLTFQESAHASFYQTFLWCRAWCETVGKTKSTEIRIVMAKDQNGEIVFILPLQIRRRVGLRVLEWLGTPHTTYGHGLFAPNFLPHARNWFAHNWGEIVKLAGPADVVLLVNMPAVLGCHPHPLQQLFNMRGPNRYYRMALTPDYEALLARKRSKTTRRYYRKKERALAALGNLTFELPANKEETHATLRTMFQQQEKRLGERGVHGIFGDVEREFVHRLAELQEETNSFLLPYVLKVQGQVLAVLLGGFYANTYWAMISSLADTDLRKFSPGELALRRTIEASCIKGLTSFDFAPGDTTYKMHWADEVAPLHVSLTAVNLRGVPWACLMGAAIFAKRHIKQSPFMRKAAMSLRQALLGRRLMPPPAQD